MESGFSMGIEKREMPPHLGAEVSSFFDLPDLRLFLNAMCGDIHVPAHHVPA